MAKKADKNMPKVEKTSNVDTLGNFVSKNRAVLIALVAVVAVGFVGFTVFEKVAGDAKEKSLSVIDRAEYTLTYQTAGLSEEELAPYYEKALNEVEPLTSKGGVVGARANVLKAEVLFRQKNFNDACSAYVAAAKKVKGTYLAPLCYFNAGAACEELNESAKALEYYELAANDKEFTDPTRALFAVGRLKEASLDYIGAKEAYEKITAKNNSQDPWSNLAKTRILSMQIEGKIE